MSDLKKEKIHVKCKKELNRNDSFIPRKYTLTHSDFTGDLFLSINCDYDLDEINDFYTKMMRDEVLAEWLKEDEKFELHIYLHVSGGFIFGWAGLRNKIFRYHLPDVLRTIRYGDSKLFEFFPELDQSPIIVHFQSNRKKYDKIERYGQLEDFTI